MSFTIATTQRLIPGLHAFADAASDRWDATVQKTKDFMASPVTQGVVGFGLGLGMHKIYGPLTEKIIKFLGFTANIPDPFGGLTLPVKIILTPLACVIGPILEEIQFRGMLQEGFKSIFETFYADRNFSDSTANIAARVTAVFFASIIFGLIHFTNAIVFWCNPILFLPQVIAATFMGLLFGLAKEFSGGLAMPIGMHMGNNTLAWVHYMRVAI